MVEPTMDVMSWVAQAARAGELDLLGAMLAQQQRAVARRYMSAESIAQQQRAVARRYMSAESIAQALTPPVEDPEEVMAIRAAA